MNHRDVNSNRRKVLFVIYNNGGEISYKELQNNLKGILTGRQVTETICRLKEGNLVRTRRDENKKNYVSLLKARIKITEDLLRESRLI
jgi:DNA-binding MarR family transcriptional regulator